MDGIIADKAWVKDLEHVFKYGNRVKPRGMEVFETIGLASVLSMSNPVIYNPLRNLGYKFMAAEAAWILSGDDKVVTIAPYSKDISRFSDNGENFFGAYGPKIVQQMKYIRQVLIEDPDSRQAVINIWRESPDPTKDVPCTLSLQFFIRHEVLHCMATMRSSDLWLGHPYDIFNFSAVSFALMLELNSLREAAGKPELSLGNLHLTAGSKHIYERNAADVGLIIEDFHLNGIPTAKRGLIFNKKKYHSSEDFIDVLWDAANSSKGALELEE